MKFILNRHAEKRIRQRLRADPDQVKFAIHGGFGVGLWHR